LCNIRDGKSAKHDEIDENDDVDVDVSFVFDCNESEVTPTTSAAAINDDIVSSRQSLSNNMI